MLAAIKMRIYYCRCVTGTVNRSALVRMYVVCMCSYLDFQIVSVGKSSTFIVVIRLICFAISQY